MRLTSAKQEHFLKQIQWTMSKFCYCILSKYILWQLKLVAI